MQLVHTQSGQLTQTHIYNSFTLQLVKIKALFQVALCIGRSLTCSDNVYNLIDVITSDDQAFKDMSTLLRLLQIVFCASNSHIMTMFNEIFHTFFQTQQPWTAFYKRNVVYRERALQSGHLEEFVQDYICICITLNIYHNAHSLSARLIIGVADTINATFFHQVCNVFNQQLLVNPIRNLGYNNLVMAFAAFDFGFSTHHDSTSTGLVSLAHTLYTINIGTRWEVWGFDILHQAIKVYVGIVNISTTSFDNFAKVVGRHIRSHTNGNTITSVYKKIRNLCRHDARFDKGIIEVVRHVYSIFLQVVHDVLTHLAESTLRITHGSW